MKNLLSTVAIISLIAIVNGCDDKNNPITNPTVNANSGNGSEDTNTTKLYNVGGKVYNRDKLKRVIAIKDNKDQVNCIESNRENYKITLTLNSTYDLDVEWTDIQDAQSGLITTFTFLKKLKDKDDYNVTIKNCEGAGMLYCNPGSNTNGKIDGADIDDANIECSFEL